MRKALYKLWRWCKGEAVLVAAALGALVTAFFVPPSVAYVDYIDLKVLCLLFSLMAVVAGWRECGVFEVLAQRLLSGRKNVRMLQLLLVMLPFFLSMLITNDVALITFVPFTLLILQMANEADRILPVVILQAVAANLGSMATPVGNPQNLFLCGTFNLTATDFFATLLPFTLVSLAVLALASLWGKKGDVQVTFKQQATIENLRLFMALVVLFGFCLLAVFRVVHYGVVTAMVVLVIALMRPALFRKVDVSLLATFVFFFIFAGNMGEIPALRAFLPALWRKAPSSPRRWQASLLATCRQQCFLQALLKIGRGSSSAWTWVASAHRLLRWQASLPCATTLTAQAPSVANSSCGLRWSTSPCLRGCCC